MLPTIGTALSLGSGLGEEVPDRAHAFEERGDVQDGRFRLPGSDDLHVDRQALPTRLEPQARPLSGYCDEVLSGKHEVGSRRAATLHTLPDI